VASGCHCPACGAALPGPPPVTCPACGAEHWRNAKPCAGALVTDGDGRLLLLRRAIEPWLGWWDIPGGFCDAEEHPMECAAREAREETGLDDLEPHPDGRLVHVAVLPVPASAKEPAHEHADLRFVLATNKPDEARPEKPTAPLRWLTFDEAGAELTEKNLREALTRGISASRSPR